MPPLTVDYPAEQNAKPMIRRIFLLGILAVLGTVSLQAKAAGGAVLRDVKVSPVGPDAARVTFDLSGTTTYKLFKLQNPDRVVVDLSDTRLAPRVKMPSAPEGVVDLVRSGAQPHGTLRVVLQVKSDMATKALWSQNANADRNQLIVSLGSAAAMPAAEVSAAVEAAQPDEPRVVRAMHAPVDSDRAVVIAVDAGHGGQDPGAIGRNGTREKDVVLAIARALAKRINAEPGMRAILTRDRDEFIQLRDRILRARAAKADLFVSVHADSIRNRDVSGSSVYVLSERGATDESARWLAERENSADLMGGVSISDKDNTLASVLLDLSNSANISTSMTAAKRVLNALDKVGEVRKPSVQQAGFVVLKSPDIPSMLVETAYISNPEEERRLRTDVHQVKLAEAIFGGLRGYFEESPPPGTLFASSRRSSSGLSVVQANPSGNSR
jgi:N-acetylmuramoyl-L-alanine amidase